MTHSRYPRLSLARRCRLTSAKQGEVIMEMEFHDGRYLVAEEWPSREAYRAHAVNREALGKMVAVSRLPA